MRGPQRSRGQTRNQSARNNAGPTNNNYRQQQFQRQPRTVNRNQPKAATIRGVTNGVRVNHTEYITPLNEFNAGYIVNGVTTENFVKLHINPGDGQTFPWLSRLAANFEYYIINSLTMTYTPTVSHNTTGGIVLSCEYDPAAPTPASLSEFLNKASSIKGQVAQYCSLTIHPTKTEKHIRTTHSASASSGDMRHMDAGAISTILYNISSFVDHDYGELSISYDVSLLRPSLSSATVKCHKHSVDGIVVDLGAAVFHPCLGIHPFDDEVKAGGSYEGHPDATLGVTTSTRQDLTRLGFDAVSSRLHFEEPFNGRLTLRTGPFTGAMAAPPGIIPQTALTRSATDDAEVAYNKIVKTVSSLAGGALIAMDIKAKAGNILDLVWDQASSYFTNNATLELMEFAAPLLLTA